jgi:hypothetical protein
MVRGVSEEVRDERHMELVTRRSDSRHVVQCTKDQVEHRHEAKANLVPQL